MGTKQIAKNTLFLYIRMGFSLIVSLFTVRIVLNALGEVDYGIYNVVAGFVGMLGFLNASLINGVQRFYNYELGQNGIQGLCNVYKSALRIQTILAVILILGIESIGGWYLNYKMVIPPDQLNAANWLMQLSLVSLLLSMMQVPYSAAMIAREKFDAYAYIGILDVLLKLAIACSIPFVPSHRLVIYGALLLIISVVNLAICFIYCKRKINEMFSMGRYDKKLTVSMVKFMGWNTFGSGAYIFRAQGLNLLLNSYFGVVLNAANGIATQISGAVQSFALNLITAFKPQMVQEYAAGNKQRSFDLMILMTKVSFALVYILSVPIILQIDYILELWLGQNVPPYTASFSCLLLISICISCWHTPIVQMIHTIGVMGQFQIVTSIIILLTLPLSWIAFRYHGTPEWAYYTTIIIYLTNQIAAMVILRSLFEYSVWNYLKKAILPCVLFSLLYPIIPYLISQNLYKSVINILVLIGASLLIAIPFVFFTVFSTQERHKIKGFVKIKLKCG